MKRIFFFFVFVCLFSAWKSNEPLLNGKVFVIRFAEEGKSETLTQDELSFGEEKMSSKKLSAEYKLEPGPYATTSITFAALNRNASGEKLLWRGTINGNSIEGTAQLLKEEKVLKVFSFIGTLK